MYYTLSMKPSLKVLIVEDDIQLSTAMMEFFTLKYFESIVSVTTGLKAIHHIDTDTFDLYILDINIPEVNGLELLEYIRKVDIKTPIIIITASLEIENFTRAFDNGCNEYIKKPFHLKELDVRVDNLLNKQQAKTVMITHDLHYDLTKEEFIYRHAPIPLRYKEKRLSTLLVNNLNTYISFEHIYDYVWEGEIKENYPLRQLIAELRRKLPPDTIKSKMKVGYMIASLH